MGIPAGMEGSLRLPRKALWWLACAAVMLIPLFSLSYWFYWQVSTSAGFPHKTIGEIGLVDLASDDIQDLSFIYTPGVSVPTGLFSLEFRGLPLESPDWQPPRFEFVLRFKHDGRTLCTMHLHTEWCNWHKPNAGLVCVQRSGEGVPIEIFEAGKTYRIEFAMKDPIQMPEGVKTVLHGSFIWRRTPTHLVD